MWRKSRLDQLPLHLMIVPGLAIVLLFSYGPMAGMAIAFQKLDLTKGLFGSPWVGFDNFTYAFKLPGFQRVLWNTVFIALMKIVVGLVVPIVFALLLNEVGRAAFKRTVQTIVYLPHFLSWVILSGIFLDVLSPSSGLVNQALGWFGVEPIFFVGNADWFPYVLVATHSWKEFGWGTIIYLAAFTGISPSLYEAAIMDGAGRWKQTIHITLPGILPIIVLMATLSLGNVLNAGFDQVFNLYSPSVYETGDILDTMVYRLGLIDYQFGVSTAVGFFKSVVSLVLMSVSYALAYRFAHYRIF